MIFKKTSEPGFAPDAVILQHREGLAPQAGAVYGLLQAVAAVTDTAESDAQAGIKFNFGGTGQATSPVAV